MLCSGMHVTSLDIFSHQRFTFRVAVNSSLTSVIWGVSVYYLFPPRFISFLVVPTLLTLRPVQPYEIPESISANGLARSISFLKITVVQ